MGDTGGEIIQVGEYNALKNPVTFLKVTGAMAGMGLLTSWLTACNSSGSELTPAQIQGTAQAALPEGRKTENLVPQWIVQRAGKIAISPNEIYGIRPDSGNGASCVKYAETNDKLAVLTAEHVGHGFDWVGMMLEFPKEKNNKLIKADGRLNSPNWATATPDDWWVLYHTPHSTDDLSELHPVRLIIFQKSIRGSALQSPEDQQVIRAYQGTPQRGETFYILGYPADNNGWFTAAEVTWQRETNPGEVQYAGIPLWEFRGPLGEGFSGAPIVTSDGQLVAIHSGGAEKDPTLGVAIPFAKYEPRDLLRQYMGV